jgi:methylated-DNA-protein-cysteine methyltransferase-like protein
MKAIEVYEAVKMIPYGHVVSYGQVAAAVGQPRSARLVGWLLAYLPANSEVPWHRVVNRKGELSIINPHVTAQQQAQLLIKEGIKINSVDDLLCLDMKKYQFFY